MCGKLARTTLAWSVLRTEATRMEGLRRTTLESGTAARRTYRVPPRVLVVEDEQDIAGLIKHTLERSGDAAVETVGRGDDALRIIAADAPDLVILDLNLPAVSGDEICRMLRQRAETADIPVIMLTARTSESDRVAGLDLGADDYVTKPFSLRELGARVRAVLRRRGRAGEDAAKPTVYRGRHLTADFDAVNIA